MDNVFSILSSIGIAGATVFVVAFICDMIIGRTPNMFSGSTCGMLDCVRRSDFDSDFDYELAQVHRFDEILSNVHTKLELYGKRAEQHAMSKAEEVMFVGQPEVLEMMKRLYKRRYYSQMEWDQSFYEFNRFFIPKTKFGKSRLWLYNLMPFHIYCGEI